MKDTVAVVTKEDEKERESSPDSGQDTYSSGRDTYSSRRDTDSSGHDELSVDTLPGDSQSEGNNQKIINNLKINQVENGGHDSGAEEEKVDVDEMANQLFQLQEMVHDMKDGFTSAMEALAQIQYGDQVLQEKVDHNKSEYQQQLTDVVQMVLSLKTEFTTVMGQLQIATDSQKSLQQEVETLQYERDILLEELERGGTISENVRNRYHSGRMRPGLLNRSSDSTTLSSLMERARGMFHSSPQRSHNDSHVTNSSHVASDHDSGVQTCPHDLSSGSDVTPPAVLSPIMKSYIEGLQENHNPVEMPEDNYESDSELAATVNKSLDLSRSLGDKCDLADLESSDDEEQKEKKDSSQFQSSPLKNKSMSQNSPYMKLGTPRKIPPHERNVREVQRLRVAREVIETERKYCASLWIILDHFSAPLKHLNIVSQKDINTMFPPSLSRIYEHHCDFLRKMEDRLANWKWQCVLGDVFSRFVESTQCDLLLQYQSYVNEFPAALYQIKKCCRNSSRFKKYLKNAQRDLVCEGLDLGSYLLTPIQRMPRYVLLLKQLHKYTDIEHPDHYYIEQSLRRVGDFLNQLNDSIQVSMQMVAADSTPKPKRKLLRIGSLRSNSISSYNDLQVCTARSRDSGNQSVCGDNQSVGSTASGRMFQLSMMKESKRKNNISTSMEPPLCPPPPPQQHNQLSSNSTNSDRDRTFAGYDASTLPTRGERRKKPRRRPKSALSELQQNTYNTQTVGYSLEPSLRPDMPRIQMNGNDYTAEIDVDQAPPHRGQHYKGRPSSAVDQTSDSSNAASSRSDYTVTPQWPLTSQDSLNTIGTVSNMSSVHGMKYPPGQTQAWGSTECVAQRRDPAWIKSMPDVSVIAGQKGAVSADVHQSMPKIHDYGIYGDSDDMGVEDSAFRPAGVAPPPRGQKLSVPQRAHSDGDMLEDGSSSPSQAQITAALARSLAGEQPADNINSHILHPQHRGSANSNVNGADGVQYRNRPNPHKPRPKSAHVRPVKLAFAEQLQQPMEQSEREIDMDVSVLSADMSMINPNDTTLKRRKKKKNKKLTESFNEGDPNKDKKKNSIRDSLKNIFFRKRGSKTLEVGIDPLDPLSPLDPRLLDRAGSTPQLAPSSNSLPRDFTPIPQQVNMYPSGRPLTVGLGVPSPDTGLLGGTVDLSPEMVQPPKPHDNSKQQSGNDSQREFCQQSQPSNTSPSTCPRSRTQGRDGQSQVPPHPQGPKEQAPPQETSIHLSSPSSVTVSSAEVLEMDCFEDENGDPCSSV